MTVLGRDIPLQHTCPWCDHVMDWVVTVGHNEAPKPGDFTVCIKCASPLRFTADMKVRPAWPKDMKDLLADDRARMDQVMAAVRDLDRTKGE